MFTVRTFTETPRMAPLYLRAAAAAIPGASALGGLTRNGHTAPELRVAQLAVTTERRRLDLYRSICGYPDGPFLPVTWPHVLAFPLQLTLMTDRRFPFPPVGLIHVENRILQLRPVPVAEPLELSVRATPPAAHPSGRTVTLITEARVAHEAVWESTSTMLRRDSHRTPAAARARPVTVGTEDRESGRPDIWPLASNLGRRYAAVSGDRNPIHTHSLAARAFGLPGMIAHGMWCNARAVAAIGDAAPERCGVDVSFRKPIVLPATVQLTTRTVGGETEFTVHGGESGAPHLRGRVWALERPAGDAGSSSG